MGSDTCIPGPCIAPEHGELSRRSPTSTTTRRSPTAPPRQTRRSSSSAAPAARAWRSPTRPTDFRVRQRRRSGAARDRHRRCDRPRATRSLPARQAGRRPRAGLRRRGNDTITLGNAFANGMTADLDGGNDNDSVTGSSGSEMLFSGNTGADTLNGGDGPTRCWRSAAAATRSTPGRATTSSSQRPLPGPRVPGRRRPGRRRLRAHEPGPEPSTATGASTPTWAIPNGNPANLGASWYGHARLLDRGGTGNTCAGGTFTYIGANNEILEGTLKQDVLIGNDVANTIWGRPGRRRAVRQRRRRHPARRRRRRQTARRRRQRPLPGRRRL